MNTSSRIIFLLFFVLFFNSKAVAGNIVISNATTAVGATTGQITITIQGGNLESISGSTTLHAGFTVTSVQNSSNVCSFSPGGSTIVYALSSGSNATEVCSVQFSFAAGFTPDTYNTFSDIPTCGNGTPCTLTEGTITVPAPAAIAPLTPAGVVDFGNTLTINAQTREIRVLTFLNKGGAAGNVSCTMPASNSFSISPSCGCSLSVPAPPAQPPSADYIVSLSRAFAGSYNTTLTCTGPELEGSPIVYNLRGTVVASPNISSFTATPNSGPSGTQTTLSWSTSGVSGNCTLSGGSISPAAGISVTPNSSQNVNVTGTAGTVISYSLACPGAALPAATATFTITSANAPSVSFNANSRPPAQSGDTASLSWSIANIAGNCVLAGPGVSPAQSSVTPTNGSLQIAAVTLAPGTYDYSLTCPNAGAAVAAAPLRFTIGSASTLPPNVLPVVQSDPVASAALPAVSSVCDGAAADSDLGKQCGLLFAPNADPANVVQAFRAVAAEELSTLVTNGQDNLNFASSGATNRLAALRGGATRQSVDDVAFNYDGKQIPTGALLGAIGALLGVAQNDEAPAGGGLLEKRLGFFGQALIRRGNRDATPTESSFDFDGYQAILGADYRFTNRFVAGLALGVGKINADLSDGGGKLNTRARFFTGYASYAPNDRAYLELAITRLHNNYTQERVIDLSRLNSANGVQGMRSVAFGDTAGNQISASLAGGYSYNFGATSVTPNLRASFGKTRVDGFNETGVSPFLLHIQDQSFDSLQYAFGVNLQHTISLESGVFAPYANMELVFERKYDAFQINTCFVRIGNCAGNNAIAVNITKADSRFGRGELGFTYLTEGGLQLGMAYTETLGYGFLTSRSISITGRFEF